MKVNIEDFTIKFKREIVYFEDYFKFNGENLSKRRKELDDCLKKDIEKNTGHENYIQDLYYMDYIKMPSYFYHSSIVTLYSFLENNLNIICVEIQKEIDSPISLDDLNGNNIISKARKFLIKFAAIDFNALEKEWLKITDYQKLRNIIVHQNSQYKSNENLNQESDDLKMIKKFSNIDIDKENRVFYIINDNLLYDFLNIINKFILEITKQITNRRFGKFKPVINPNDLPF